MSVLTGAVFVLIAVLAAGVFLTGRRGGSGGAGVARGGFGAFGAFGAEVESGARAADRRDAEALEAEDLAQMLAAHNARRRARGERELSVADVELQVSRDEALLAAERARYRR